jgi:hypothetical protein
MASQTKCSATTGENTRSTSAKAKKDTGKYRLVDLNRLTFNLDGVEQVLDVETATPEQFQAFASAQSDIEDVDVSVWPLEVRRDFVNELWEFCSANSYEFPLTEMPEKIDEKLTS